MATSASEIAALDGRYCRVEGGFLVTVLLLQD